MNRFLRNFFFVLAIGLVAYAILFAHSLRATGQLPWHAKTIWAELAAAIFFAMAGWRFSLEIKFKFFAVLLGLLSVEVLLQVTAWLGVLPAVNTKLKAPFARVYWTLEGRGNDIRNRYGWHFPEFDLQAPKRIVFIGDSFVEAVEVGRNQNEAADLQRLLRVQSSDWAVLAFGTHGTCPAHHLDVLDYARQYFAPQEAVVILYLGNDINESLPALNYTPPVNFIYYDLDSNNRLVLNPASTRVREQFDQNLNVSRQSFLTTLPVLLNSHCMTLQLAASLRDSFVRRRELPKLAAADPEAARYGRIGLSLKPYAVPADEEAQHALAVMFAELTLLKQKCDTNHIKLRLVTVPFFPPQFYATQHGAAWSLKIAGYDFLSPDRQIAAFARENDIPFLSFADWLATKKMTAEEIQSLYFNNGSGHFTQQGHALCAEAIFNTFYAKQ